MSARRSRDDPAQDIIGALGLEPHPEGGWFVRTWADEPQDGGRGTGSAIYYLLRGSARSRWHRIDATEIWHHYTGGPLELRFVLPGGAPEVVVFGPDLADGQRPQATVLPHAWQSVGSLGAYTLVGTTVSPAFHDDGFELAPQGWEPPEFDAEPA